ncbi:MAG TPA: YjbE family putative metal transport protein [Devosia sp.]|nr:YjbE family putative metal transport protein [Devosia sp.]
MLGVLEPIASYLQIIVINVVLSGDNLIVIGLAVAPLPPEMRRKAIAGGVAAAAAIRVGFGLAATQLLTITGLQLAGGLLLLWVCWSMFRELRGTSADEGTVVAETSVENKSLIRAIGQIVVADFTMSLDNILAVAGAARTDFAALAVGVTLSVVAMGLAASIVARFLDRNPWLGWVGLAVITYVAGRMIFEGLLQVTGHA